MKYNEDKYISMDGKEYRITGCTNLSEMVFAQVHMITNRKDYGWREVKSYEMKHKLYVAMIGDMT